MTSSLVVCLHPPSFRPPLAAPFQQQIGMAGSLGVLVKYTGSLLPLLLGPPAIIYVLVQISSVNLPWYATVALCLGSLPFAFACWIQWETWRDERNAKRLGAVLPPRVFDPSIGGGNILKRMVDNFRRGYLGTLLSIMCSVKNTRTNTSTIFAMSRGAHT